MYAIYFVFVGQGTRRTYPSDPLGEIDERSSALVERVLASGRLRVVHGSDSVASSSICAPVQLPNGELVGALATQRRGASSEELRADVASTQRTASLLGQCIALERRADPCASLGLEGPRVAIRCGDVVVLARPGSVALEPLGALEPELAELTATSAGGTLDESLDALERRMLARALDESKGNRAAAARALGISERRMGLRVHKYGLD